MLWEKSLTALLRICWRWQENLEVEKTGRGGGGRWLLASADEDISPITCPHLQTRGPVLNPSLSKILRNGRRYQPLGIHDSNLFAKINPGSITSMGWQKWLPITGHLLVALYLQPSPTAIHYAASQPKTLSQRGLKKDIKCKILMTGERGCGVHGNSPYYLLNFSVNLKLKKLKSMF